MAFSVNTNPAALTAVQALAVSQLNQAGTINTVNTGRTINGAQDGGAAFIISQSIRADIGGLNALGFSSDRASGVLDIAISGGEAVSNLLIEQRTLALQASDPGLDQASRDALGAQFDAISQQIDNITGQSSFNGTNLLDGSQGTNAVAVPSAPDGAGVAVSADGADLSTAGLGVSGAGLGSAADAQAALAQVDAALGQVNGTLAGLGAASQGVDLNAQFNQELQDTLTIGVGNLVDANLAREAANLAASNVSVQLGVVASNIANQSNSVILGLFA